MPQEVQNGDFSSWKNPKHQDENNDIPKPDAEAIPPSANLEAQEINALLEQSKTYFAFIKEHTEAWFLDDNFRRDFLTFVHSLENAEGEKGEKIREVIYPAFEDEESAGVFTAYDDWRTAHPQEDNFDTVITDQGYVRKESLKTLLRDMDDATLDQLAKFDIEPDLYLEFLANATAESLYPLNYASADFNINESSPGADAAYAKLQENLLKLTAHRNLNFPDVATAMLSVLDHLLPKLYRLEDFVNLAKQRKLFGGNELFKEKISQRAENRVGEILYQEKHSSNQFLKTIISIIEIGELFKNNELITNEVVNYAIDNLSAEIVVQPEIMDFVYAHAGDRSAELQHKDKEIKYRTNFENGHWGDFFYNDHNDYNIYLDKAQTSAVNLYQRFGGWANFKTFIMANQHQLEHFFDEEGQPTVALYISMFQSSSWEVLTSTAKKTGYSLPQTWQYAINLDKSLNRTSTQDDFRDIVASQNPDTLTDNYLDAVNRLSQRLSKSNIINEALTDEEKKLFDTFPDKIRSKYLLLQKSDFLSNLEEQSVAEIENQAITTNNILDFLAAFINLDANDWEDFDYSSALKDKIKAVFSENGNKDLALNTLQNYWLDYLNSNNVNNFPLVLEAFALHNKDNEGAGPLTQIESFLDFMLAYKNKLSTQHISDLAKQKFQTEHGRLPTAEEESELAKQKSENLFLQTKNIEERFTREKWEQAEISNFYNVSSEILNADARLYIDFIEFFNKLNKEYFKKFVTEIYPLYRAKLSLLKKYDDFSNGIGSGYSTADYSHLNLGNLRRDLRAVLETFDPNELDSEQNSNNFKDVKAKMLTEIKNAFQEKFAILPEAIPTNFTDAQIKSMENLVLYNSNIANPDQQKESLIGFYLALLLQGQGDHTGWQKLREGEINGASGLLTTDQAIPIDLLIANQKEQSFFTPEITNLPPEQIPKFIKALQVEGLPLANDSSVQTIDLKLQNLIGNLQELTDEDYYQAPVEKGLLRLLQNVSNKDFGRVVAKLHQETSGKNIAWQEDELPIKQQIIDLFNHSEVNLSLTPDNIKKYLQDGSKVLTTTLSITQLIENSGAKTEIIALQNLLSPSGEIIAIFNRLGENFQNNSGARALSTDLDNLENLIVKKEDELKPDEKKLLTDYLSSIREQMGKLEKIYGQIANKFGNIKKGLHTNEQSALTKKITEIDGIIAGTKDNQTITTRLTSDLNVIIQNMRACLSAKTKGINNDTDLTFGEPYKFYLYSHNETNKTGSISDEIVYFVPNTTITKEKREDGTENEVAREIKLSFVMDQLYGQKTSDVFYNHVAVLINKLQNLHQQFPDVPLSVFVTQSAMSSIGVNGEIVKQKFSEHGNLSFENVENNTVNVPESVFGDHYVEFGGGTRTAGEREVSGLEIKVK